jgi:hypothetical protein
MAEAVYGIDDLPDDDLLWRIEWVGGVGYNTSVPSDPLIGVCLAQLPTGETNPLGARARSFQTKRTAKISVGLLPYISISSVWRRQRPVFMNLADSRHSVTSHNLFPEDPHDNFQLIFRAVSSGWNRAAVSSGIGYFACVGTTSIPVGRKPFWSARRRSPGSRRDL